MKQKKRKVNVKEIDLPSILSGEILYDILTHSSDPESIMVWLGAFDFVSVK